MFYKTGKEFKERGVGMLHMKDLGSSGQILVRADTSLGKYQECKFSRFLWNSRFLFNISVFLGHVQLSMSVCGKNHMTNMPAPCASFQILLVQGKLNITRSLGPWHFVCYIIYFVIQGEIRYNLLGTRKFCLLYQLLINNIIQSKLFHWDGRKLLYSGTSL